MLKGMAQHQANHHPVAFGMAVLLLGPFALAAVLLYAAVFLAALGFKLAFGRKR